MGSWRDLRRDELLPLRMQHTRFPSPPMAFLMDGFLYHSNGQSRLISQETGEAILGQTTLIDCVCELQISTELPAPLAATFQH